MRKLQVNMAQQTPNLEYLILLIKLSQDLVRKNNSKYFKYKLSNQQRIPTEFSFYSFFAIYYSIIAHGRLIIIKLSHFILSLQFPMKICLPLFCCVALLSSIGAANSPNQFWKQQATFPVAWLNQNVDRISILSGERLSVESYNKASNTRSIITANGTNFTNKIQESVQPVSEDQQSKVYNEGIATSKQKGSYIAFQDYNDQAIKFASFGTFIQFSDKIVAFEEIKIEGENYISLKYLNIKTKQIGFLQDTIKGSISKYYPPLFKDISSKYFGLFLESKAVFLSKQTLRVHQILVDESINGFQGISSLSTKKEIYVAVRYERNYQKFIYSFEDKFDWLTPRGLFDGTNSFTFINTQSESRSTERGTLYKWRNYFGFNMKQTTGKQILKNNTLVVVFDNEDQLVLVDENRQNLIYYSFDSNSLQFKQISEVKLPNTLVKNSGAVSSQDAFLTALVEDQNNKRKLIRVDNKEKNIQIFDSDSDASCMSFTFVNEDQFVSICESDDQSTTDYQIVLVRVSTFEVLDKIGYAEKSGDRNKIKVLSDKYSEGKFIALRQLQKEDQSSGKYEISSYRIEESKIKKSESLLQKSLYDTSIVCQKYLVTTEPNSERERSVRIVNLYNIQTMGLVNTTRYESGYIQALQTMCSKSVLSIRTFGMTQRFKLGLEKDKWLAGVFFHQYSSELYPLFEQKKIMYTEGYQVQNFYDLSKLPVYEFVPMIQYESTIFSELYVPKRQTNIQDENFCGFSFFTNKQSLDKLYKFKDNFSGPIQSIQSFSIVPPYAELLKTQITSMKASGKKYLVISFKGTKEDQSQLYYVQVRSIIQTGKILWIYSSKQQIKQTEISEQGQIVLSFQTRVQIHNLIPIIFPSDYSISKIASFDIKANCHMFGGADLTHSDFMRIFYFQQDKQLQASISPFSTLMLADNCDYFAITRNSGTNYEIWGIANKLEKVYGQSLPQDAAVNSIKFGGDQMIILELSNSSKVIVKKIGNSIQQQLVQNKKLSALQFQVSKDGFYLAEKLNCCSLSITQLRTKTIVNQVNLNETITGIAFSSSQAGNFYISTNKSNLRVYSKVLCPEYSIIVNQTCQCQETFITIDGMCKCPDYSEVINGFCQCKNTFIKKEGNCTCPTNSQVVGQSCQCLDTFIKKNDQCKCPQYSKLTGHFCECFENFVKDGLACTCQEGYISESKCMECSAFCKSCDGPGLSCGSYSILFYILIVAGILLIAAVIMIVVIKMKKDKEKKRLLLIEQEQQNQETVITEGTKGK